MLSNHLSSACSMSMSTSATLKNMCRLSTMTCVSGIVGNKGSVHTLNVLLLDCDFSSMVLHCLQGLNLLIGTTQYTQGLLVGLLMLY